MSGRRRASLFRTLVLLAGFVAPATAGAQVFGTFSWQMQPYCNVVTLTLSLSPAGFLVDGSDNQCGAVNKAGAVGVATFNASGNVTFTITIVAAPSGQAVHVSALVSPANGQGSWTDSTGNSGTFAFLANTGGPPRPSRTVVSVNGASFVPVSSQIVTRAYGGCSYNSTNNGVLFAGVPAPIGTMLVGLKAMLYDNDTIFDPNVAAFVFSNGVLYPVGSVTTSGAVAAIRNVDGVVSQSRVVNSGDTMQLAFTGLNTSGLSQVCAVELAFARP